MCACKKIDVRESANDCTLASGEGHGSRGETFHSLCAASPVSSSAERTVLYNTCIIIDFGVPMKQVRLIKMCLNETYSKVSIGTHLSDNFLIQKGLNQGDALLPFLFNFPVKFLSSCTIGSFSRRAQLHK
jgi:hypothetical protein